MAQRFKTKPINSWRCSNESFSVLAAVPVLHAIEGGEGVKEHVEEPVV